MGGGFCKKRIAAAGHILQKADRRSGADSGKGGLPQRGRSCKGLVQREAVHLSTSILLRILLAAMLQFA